MNKKYISENLDDGIFLADQYLGCFIKGYREKNYVGIFLLGHAIELYAKCLYWKIHGYQKEKNTHNIRKILEELIPYNNDIKIIIKDIDNIKSEQLNLIYNGGLADLKYLNMNHNNINKKYMNECAIDTKEITLFFKHLLVIFESLNKNENNSYYLKSLIIENDNKIQSGNFFIADAEIYLFLKLSLNQNYEYKTFKGIFGEIKW